MRFEYAPYDATYYVTSVAYDSGTKQLKWRHTTGIDSLVIQTPFGVNAIDMLEPQLVEALNNVELFEGAYTEVLSGVFARIVSSAELSRGFKLDGGARTYTVFALKREGDTYQVFEQRWRGIIRPWRDVPQELSVRVNKEMRTEGFFKKREVFTGFYHIGFGELTEKTYVNGDLYYKVGDFEIPITETVIEQQDVYVKTNTRPQVFSRNAAIKLV